MRRWVTDYLATMKLVTNKQTTIKLLAEILSEYKILTEENPFAAAAEEGEGEDSAEEKGEEDASAEGGDAKAEDKDDKKSKQPQPAGLTVDFNISAVKKYNDTPFRLNRGEVKAINKNGLQVAVDNGQTIHVNFQDLTNK